MRTKPLIHMNTRLQVRSYLDLLRTQLVDLDALTNGARTAMNRLPSLPTRPWQPAPHAGARAPEALAGERADEIEAQRNYGRLQVLVTAAAEMAEQVMNACEAAIDRIDEGEGEDEDQGGNGGGGPAGAGQSSDPGALTRDHGDVRPILDADSP